MSKWADPEEWRRLLSREGCPICRNGKPTNIIAELKASYLVAGEEAALKGACSLFYKRHAVELSDLSPVEAADFIADVQKAAKAVQEITGALKMNYEIHGNTIPHLHLHLFPRYRGDRFENQPINPRLTNDAVYEPGEFSLFVERVRAALGRS